MTSGAVGCKRTHHIEVDYLDEAEAVQHSLLLIKGRLQPACASAKQLKATLKLRRENDEQNEEQLQEQLTQLSAAGEFKLLFDLEEEAESATESSAAAVCELELRCCSGTQQLRFNYRPRRSEFRLQPLYLVCQSADKSQEQSLEQQRERERCELIDLNLRLVQCIYAHKLRAAGFANCTFSLNGGCCVFRSQLSCAAARESSEDELWQHFATEILASAKWGQQLRLKFVAFIGCTSYDGAAVAATGDFSYANIRRHLGGHAALGGGGLALFGSAHFYAWPQRFSEIGDCIRSAARIDLTRLPDESNYRRTYGGVYASTLGAVCHELGHCFDLGHTQDGVMGHGFDFLNRVLTVDQPTEHLPQRIVAATTTTTTNTNTTTTARPRFTQLKLKGSTSQLLDNYHSQRRNDSFYFTRNCAVILAHHRWLRSASSESSESSQDLKEPDIRLDLASSSIISTAPLRLIELRCNLNSLVAHYEEFTAAAEAVHRFQLPAALWHLLAKQRSHYAFVLSCDGDTKRLACDDDGDVDVDADADN